MKTIQYLGLGLLLAGVPAGRANIIYSGGVNDLISPVSNTVELDNGATLNVHPGANITAGSQQWAYGLAINNGTANIWDASVTGGAAGQNWADGIWLSRGTVNLYSGTVTGGSGNWASGMVIGGGTVNLYGGSVHGGTAFYAFGIDVEGGTLNVYGGNIQGGNSVSFGLPLEVGSYSRVNIYGSGFNFGYGPVNQTGGVLTGVLDDGSPLKMLFTQFSPGEIVLVPEPAAAGLVTLGLLALLGRRSRKQKHCR
jgi:hypothetical protein